MPASILFADGLIKFAGGQVLLVPDGADPDDCDCCGSQCPVCDEYTYGSIDVTVSGFPTSITWQRYMPFVNQPYTETWDGLQKLNGVYTIDTDENCLWLTTSKTFTVDVTRTFYTGSYCSPGTVVRTESDTTPAKLLIGSGTVWFNINPVYMGLRNIYLTIFDHCVGGTDSEFFAANMCPSIVGFTAVATWVPTLV